MTDTPMTMHSIDDNTGGSLGVMRHTGGVYLVIDDEGRTAAAGPFTRAQLDEALDAVAPAGNSTGPHVHHEAPNRDDYPRGGLLQTSPALAAFNTERRARAERERLGRIVQAVADGDGHTTQVYGVKIAPCDTHGRTRDEVAASVNAARAEDRRTLIEAERDELREKLTAAEQDRAAADASVEQMARDIDTICTQRNTARAERDEARARAEKAEKERDEARGALRARLGVLAQPRPLTPDAITDETRERAYRAVAALSVSDWDGMSDVAKGGVMALVEAVITEITRPEPPARPEGAEELNGLIGEYLDSTPGVDDKGMADFLAEHGVRVVSEDGPR